MDHLVSVVIPCYNGARFLDEALISVLAQSHANKEVIVVDDGSTDNSAEIATRYPSVRYIRQRNAGVAAARNTGLRYSRGDYVVLLDQDDRLLPDALESNLRCLVDRPAYAFVFGDAQSIGDDGSLLPHRTSSPHEGNNHYLSLLRGNYIWTPGVVMYRRGIRDGLLQFDTKAEPSDDFELNLRIARQYPVYHNNTVVLEYRMHGTNTGRRHAVMLRAGLTVVRNQRRWVQHDRRGKQALADGLRFIENYYGNLLISQMAADIRNNQNWRQTCAGLQVLLRYTPHLLVRRALRKAVRPRAADKATLPWLRR